MKYSGLILLTFLLSAGLLVSAKGRHGRGRGGNSRTPSVKSIKTCMGLPIDLASQLSRPEIQKCLNERVQEFMDQGDKSGESDESGEDGRGHGRKKKDKKRGHLANMSRQKCTPECELRKFDLIPDVDDGDSSYPSQEIPDEFIKKFPKEAQDKLKNKMQACYTTTKPADTEGGKKKGLKNNLCSGNMNLVKCLAKSVQQICNEKGGVPPGNDTSTATTTSTTTTTTTPPPANKNAKNDKDKGKKDASTTTTTTTTTTLPPEDEEMNDDDADDDEEHDDEKNTTTPVPTTKATNKITTKATTTEPTTSSTSSATTKTPKPLTKGSAYLVEAFFR